MRFAGHREWVGNFLHLVWMRGVNLILPLISIPYLMRVLGVDAWGRLYVAQSVQALALLLGESGLFLWAVREVALRREDAGALSDLLSRIYSIKAVQMLLLAILGALLIAVWVPFDQRMLMFLSLLAGLVGGWFPTWFFIGHGGAGRMNRINTPWAVLNTLMLLFCVRGPEHLVRVPFIYLLGALGTVLCAFLSLRKAGISMEWTGWGRAWGLQREIFPYLVSNVAMYINTMAAPLLMGGLMGLPARYLGWYGIGEKPIRLLKELFMPLLDALTPHFARVAERAPGRWRRDLWRVMGVVSVANAVLMVSLWFWGRTLIGLLSGARHECSIKVLVWLSPILLVSLVGGILGRCVLLACRRDAELNRIYWGAALTWLTLMGILAWALAPWLNHEQMLLGVAAVAVFNEVLMVGRLMRRSRWLMRDRSSGEGF